MSLRIPSSVIKLPFRIRQFSEQMLSKLNRNFDELEIWLTRFATDLWGRAPVWDRASNINPDGTFPVEKLTDKYVGLTHALQLVDQAVTNAKVAVDAIGTLNIQAGAVTPVKTSFPNHLLDGGYSVFHNTPSVGYIQWQNLAVVYRGTRYAIPDGYTNKRFIWWDYDYPNQLQMTDIFPDQMTDDDLLVFLNKNGIAVVVPKATVVPGDLIVPGSILTEHLSANSVTGEKIKAGGIDANHIKTGAIIARHLQAGIIDTKHIAAEGLDAKVIKTGELDAMKVDVVGKDRMVRLVGDGMVVYDREGGEAAKLGYYETLGDQVATFTRNSVAYTSDGRQVASGQERYEWVRLPYPVWQDTFDTDQLATQYVSGGDVPATWSASDGVLTGTGGTQATLIKNDLYLQDCEIVVNSDQAQDGGIVARYQDNNNYYLLALYDDSGTAPAQNLRIYKRVGGTFTMLAYADVTWPRGTAKQVKFVLRGSVLEAYFDGTKVISVTDTTFTGGQVGLRNHSTTAFRVLDFIVYYAVQGVTSEESTTNLLTANQSSVETDLTGLGSYSPNGGQVLSRDTTTAWHGSASAKVVNGNATAQSIFITTSPLRTSVNPSTTYTFSVMAKAAAVPGRRWRVGIWWFDSAGSPISLSAGTPSIASSVWTRLSITATSPSNAASCYLELVLFNAAQNEAIWWDGAQLEAKPYATSWTLGGTTRSAEVLTVPTAGVFNKGNWTVKLRFTPTSSFAVANRHLWRIEIDANNNYVIWIDSTGKLNARVRSGGTSYLITDSTALTVGSSYLIMFSGNGSVIRFCKNGTQIGTDTTYVEPVGTLPANMYIGCSAYGTEQANGIISDFVIMSKAQTLAEHQAEYQSGKPLKVDDYTTLLMSMDGTLKPTVRRLGLWSKNSDITLENPPVEGGIRVYDAQGNLRTHIGQYAAGKYGIKVINGEIYATSIKSGTPEAVTRYIQIDPGGVLYGVGYTGKVIEIGTGYNQGNIKLYDAGTERAQILLNAASTRELWLWAKNGSGISLQADTGEDITLGPYSGLTSARGNKFSAGTGTNTFYGGLVVASGTKNCAQPTENFGMRLLSARESPEIRFVDEGIGTLDNGECVVYLDPIFLECIEPDSDTTPWIIHLTPYADVEIYVAEIGVDYFKVKARSMQYSSIRFAWSLSATRKGYALIRLPEVLDVA